jgi:WD40 repeat protein/ABC-type sugar transport system substrate-binding protein
VGAVPWAADGTPVASACRDGTARVGRLGGGAGLGGAAAVLGGHDGEVTAVDWSDAPVRLLTAGVDGTIRIWNPGEEAPTAILTGHQGAIQVARFAGRRFRAPAVVSGGFDGAVRFWDPGPGYQRIPRTEPDIMPLPWDARWSPDGERIATGHQDGSVRVWNALTGRQNQVLSLPPAAAGGETRTGPVVEVAWSPGGDALLAVSRDHRAVCWHLESGAATVFEGHRTGVQHGAWSPSGDRIAPGSGDGALHVWRPGSPEESGSADHGGGVNGIAWHPDGRRLLTAGDDGALVIWDVGEESPLEPRRLRTLEGHLSAILHALWSPDGRSVASVGADQTVRLWDGGSGRLERTLVGHRGWTLQVAWSPDGRQLASAGRDGTVRLWRLEGAGDGPGDHAAAGDRSIALEGHRSAVRRLSFSPDGSRLVTGGQDAEVRLWHAGLDDPRRGDEVVVLARHDTGAVRLGYSGVVQIAWSPAGDRLLTLSLDGTMRIYRARLDDLVREAEHRAVRGPRPDEVEHYGLEALAPEPERAEGPAPEPATAFAAGPDPEPAGGTGAPPERPLRIGAIVFAENEWAIELHRGLVMGRDAAPGELGVEVELEIEHHQFSLADEIALIDRFLDSGIDALVISPRDLEASVPKIREAHERGVAVVCVGTSINLRDAARYVDAIYESDQFELGYRTGYYLGQWLVDRGLGGSTLDLGIVQCERFEQCYQRGRGFRAALLYAGLKWREVSIVQGLVVDQAERRAEAMLREHPEILVVFTQHDESTRGAVEAVRKLGLAGKVFVFGTDIADSIAQMLADPDDVLQATTGQQARRMGRDGVLDAVRSVLGRDLGPRHKVLASPLYTREPWHAEALKTWIEEGESG